MPVTSLNKPTLRAIREVLELALRPIADQMGVQIKLGNCSFTANNATYKLEVSVKTPDGAVVTKDAECFQRMSRLYGVDPGMLGKNIRLHDGEYTLVGLNPKARKFPFVGKRVDNGRTFKLSESSVKFAIAQFAAVKADLL